MIKTALCLAIGLALSSCSVGPNYQAPNPSVPKQWSSTLSSPENPAQTSAEAWWTAFNDPILNQLIRDALVENLDLKQALLRVKDARTQRWITITAGLPSLTAKSSETQRFNNFPTGSQTTSGSSVGAGSQVMNIFQMGFDAQWELDIFGGERRAIEAADANIDSEIENSRQILVTLLAEVARNYIQLRNYQQLTVITQNNLASQQETVQLTKIRQQAGFVSFLEVAQAEAQAKNTAAALPNYDTIIKQSIHSLSILLNKAPNALSQLLTKSAPIPSLSNPTLTSLPSELLQRRPDIRLAERLVAKASANIGVATADLYPRFNLAAFIGLQNTKISDFTPISKSWSSASTVTLPIFNWGKINANIKSKKLQHDVIFIDYEKTVLTAFKEVEDNLIAYQNELQRNQALSTAVDSSQLALEMANERYHKGLTMFLDVLQTQEALYQAQRNLVDSQAQLAVNLVALYKALGGGWQNQASVSKDNLLKS